MHLPASLYGKSDSSTSLAGFAGSTRAELLIDPPQHDTVRHTFVRAHAPLPLNAYRSDFCNWAGAGFDRLRLPYIRGVNKKTGDQNGDL
jgi:hypothetical protein